MALCNLYIEMQNRFSTFPSMKRLVKSYDGRMFSLLAVGYHVDHDAKRKEG